MLGLRRGSTENGPVARALLAELVKQGLSGDGSAPRCSMPSTASGASAASATWPVHPRLGQLVQLIRELAPAPQDRLESTSQELANSKFNSERDIPDIQGILEVKDVIEKRSMNAEPIGKRRLARSPASGSPSRVMLQSKPATTDASESPATTGGQDVSVMFATLVGMAGLTLLIQGLLAYMLLPEGRGAYAVCIAFGTLLGVLLTPGAQQGAQYFVAVRQMSVSQGVSSALIICFAGGGLAAALAVPLIYSGLAFFQKAETHTFLLSLALIPFTAISIALDHQLVALRRFRRLAVFSMLRIAANVLTLLVLVRSLGLGVDGAIIAFAAGHGVMIAACLQYLWRHDGLAFELPDRLNISRVLGYGLKYHAARLGHAVEPHFGVVILGLLASEGEIGLFAAASALMLGFMLVSNSVGDALLLLYPRLGVEAAAWGMTIGMMCGCSFLSIVFHRTTGTGLLAVWLPRRSDASFLWTAGRSALSGWTRGSSAACTQLQKEQASR